MSPVPVGTWPRPGDVLSGMRVVASVIYRDDKDGDEWTVLGLEEEAPFFSVAIYKITGFGSYTLASPKQRFMNIVPAVREYEQMGGDY